MTDDTSPNPEVIDTHTSENLLSNATTEIQQVKSPNTLALPHNIPEKFWNAEQGEIRSDALAKSYMELERRLGGPDEDVAPNPDRPENADDYQISFSTEELSADPQVNQQLFEAGFNQSQAQLVYALAEQHLMPMAEQMSVEFEANKQLEQLSTHFGGEEKWSTVSGQLKTWGQSHYPDTVFKALSSTYEGVIAMHQMMSQKSEPGLINAATPANGMISEAGLKQLMKDPRYWRDKDPAFLDQVEQGFKRLYPD